MSKFSSPEEFEIFYIPKKKEGKFRRIEAPKEDLKEQLKEDLEIFYSEFKVSPFAHGFVPHRNVITNAVGHVGKHYVMGMDIKNFFPSITWPVFRWTIESDPEAYLRNPNLLDKLIDIARRSFVKFNRDSEPRLAQGSPTSPYLSNVLLVKFDWMVARTMKMWYGDDIDYSRYADDITISSNSYEHLLPFFPFIRKALKKYGLKINREKNRILGRGRQQRVCGLVVNEKIQTPKKVRKLARAIKHNALVKQGRELTPKERGYVEWAEMGDKVDEYIKNEEYYKSSLIIKRYEKMKSISKEI